MALCTLYHIQSWKHLWSVTLTSETYRDKQKLTEQKKMHLFTLFNTFPSKTGTFILKGFECKQRTQSLLVGLGYLLELSSKKVVLKDAVLANVPLQLTNMVMPTLEMEIQFVVVINTDM